MQRKEVNQEKLSPMMKQYMEIKNRYEDCLLFFRLGDFYELFFEDGVLCSKELELTLTGKNAGLEERIPMCGVPFHSVKPYIEKLVEKGYKVAICEQLEDPSTTKGMVKRDVVNVISKGTMVDLDSLNPNDPNYIGSILDTYNSYIITYADISTGELYSEIIPHIDTKLFSEILNLNLKEILLKSGNTTLLSQIENNYGISCSETDELLNNEYENLYSNIDDKNRIEGIQHLLYYLVKKELKTLTHFNIVKIIDKSKYLEMDVHTVRNLELIETIRTKDRNYSLLGLLDKTITSMGSRLLKNNLMNPLRDTDIIIDRYNKIEILNNEFILKEELKNILNSVYDIERLCGKVITGSLNARDLLQLKESLKYIPNFKTIIKDLKFDYKIYNHEELYDLLDLAIVDNPPATIKEGFMIKNGYNKELDELKTIRSGGKNFISSLEISEREKTGIKNLKVGYNRVFGYYIEITKGQMNNVDPSWGWERKQTLSDKERYISKDLKETEALVLNAEDRIIELEYSLFIELKNFVKEHISELKSTASTIAELDFLCSLATIAENYSFVRPELIKEHNLEIIDGRHPVISTFTNIEYIPNDTILDEKTNTLLITGPNMSGKSTYMRQIAIIIIMAQMGSFVPATKCRMPIFDKIFTRIGASDDLVSGESTFMVEMLEARNAIVNATENSLILFDELGRGTATYDGMSLAQAILEYVNNNIKCKTLFSTHYHEITSLSESIPSIKNVHVEAINQDGNIIFLHKIKDGSIASSYGIHVASLANMPSSLINRANELLEYYENNNTKSIPKEIIKPKEIINKNDTLLKKKLSEINIMEITPLGAINIIDELIRLSKE